MPPRFVPVVVITVSRPPAHPDAWIALQMRPLGG
jgi:hypothetical protein